VLNVAAIAGIIAVRERPAYATTKSAAAGLTKALALRLDGGRSAGK
jgi:NAD(P)-dependent dehydrogenase (short-subunit alcohol dehydrogenase family)